jgi:hypothetical protein
MANDQLRTPEMAQSDAETEAFGFLQLADTPVLARIARGEIDLNALARRELANRGCDGSGRWVGFAAADAWLALTD